MTDTKALAGRIRQALHTITRHYDATLQPATRSTGTHATAAVFASLPVSADILDVRADTRRRLAHWAWVTIRDRDLHTEHLSAHDVPAMCDLLQRHAEWLAGTPNAPIAAFELEASARELRAHATPHRRDFMALGACPLDVDTENGPALCGGQVRAYPDRDPKCVGCGTEAVTSWWEGKMFTDPELTRLLTAPDLVVFVHKQFGRVVTEVQVRQWISRGIITKAGTDVKGRTLYDRGAVAYSLERRKILA